MSDQLRCEGKNCLRLNHSGEVIAIQVREGIVGEDSAKEGEVYEGAQKLEEKIGSTMLL